MYGRQALGSMPYGEFREIATAAAGGTYTQLERQIRGLMRGVVWLLIFTIIGL